MAGSLATSNTNGATVTTRMRYTAILLLLTANSLFAVWDIIIREFYALNPHPFHPLLFLAVRSALSSVINICIALYFEGTTITTAPAGKFKFDNSRFLESLLQTKTKRRLGILAASITGIYCAQLGYLYGVKFTSATHGAVMQPLIAVVAMVMAILVGAETFGTGVAAKKKLYGLILCVGGAMVVVLGSEHHKRRSNDSHSHAVAAATKSVSRDLTAKSYPILGTAFILTEVFAVAFFYVILPVLSRFYKSAWLASMILLSSLPMYIVSFFLFIEIETLQPNQLIVNKEFIYSMAYCVFNTIFYNFAIVWSSKYLEGSFASLFACSHPIATSILSVVILSHPISIYDFAGGILIVFGFYQSTKAKFNENNSNRNGNEFDVDIEKLGESRNKKNKPFKPYRDSSSSSDDDEIGELNDNYDSDVSL
jgi:drug/metabolite transporter (DMT)-like permease